MIPIQPQGQKGHPVEVTWANPHHLEVHVRGTAVSVRYRGQPDRALALYHCEDDKTARELGAQTAQQIREAARQMNGPPASTVALMELLHARQDVLAKELGRLVVTLAQAAGITAPEQEG